AVPARPAGSHSALPGLAGEPRPPAAATAGASKRSRWQRARGAAAPQQQLRTADRAAAVARRASMDAARAARPDAGPSWATRPVRARPRAAARARWPPPGGDAKEAGDPDRVRAASELTSLRE